MYLSDMLAATRAALGYMDGRTRVDLDDDPMLRDAVIRQLEILGEAATHVSVTTRDAQPSIPWRGLAGMRNVLIHAYHRVDLDEVWHTTSVDLPALLDALERLVAEVGLTT
ncbi:MAG: DUF86 domain-containing protein [Deltaproteobacteria bacterium]|nr:DUF86 domain-containing protein [Deltaproteobacteria bacterium]